MLARRTQGWVRCGQLIRSLFESLSPTTRRKRSWTANLRGVRPVGDWCPRYRNAVRRLHRCDSCGRRADHAGDEEPREVPKMAETRIRHSLLRNKVECSGGNLRLVRCIQGSRTPFWAREMQTPNRRASRSSFCCNCDNSVFLQNILPLSRKLSCAVQHFLPALIWVTCSQIFPISLNTKLPHFHQILRLRLTRDYSMGIFYVKAKRYPPPPLLPSLPLELSFCQYSVDLELEHSQF